MMQIYDKGCKTETKCSYSQHHQAINDGSPNTRSKVL